jgi:cation diffusion facilitator CzcD-associated flavoprotein CzcO
LAASRLQKKGFDDFVLLERNAELGGTWQVNSYPGAEVDVPTSLYCISFIPFAFTKSSAPQSELLAYTNHIIEKFGLRKHARTKQTVTRLAYDEREFLWHVDTESGQRYSAHFVIDSVCSAAQIVPAIAGKVSRLTLFMGKAQWILPRSDRHYGAVERVVRTLPGIRHLIRWPVFALHDIRFIGFRRYPGMSGISRLIKRHYRSALQKQLDRYIHDDKARWSTWTRAGSNASRPKASGRGMARTCRWTSSSTPRAISPFRTCRTR